jgi:hypothetical protein
VREISRTEQRAEPRAQPGRKNSMKKNKKLGKRRSLGLGPRLSPRLSLEILVFIFFVLVRLPSLGHDNFNTDVWRWKARSYDFGSGVTSGNFEMTLQKYHPGVTLMWLGSVGAKINNLYSTLTGISLVAEDSVNVIFQLDFIQKLLLVIVLGLTTSMIFYVLKNVIDVKYALISVIFLSLEPFYLGLTRVFHLEGMVSTFMLASVLWLFYFFHDGKKRKRVLVSGIFAGLALLTKTSAFFLVLFSGLTILIHTYRNGNYSFSKKGKDKFNWDMLWSYIKSFGSVFLPWFLALVVVFFALWQAMWVMPGRVFNTLYGGIADIGGEGDHFQFYFGKLVEDPGPSFYFVVLALRSSIYLLIGFVGTLFVRKKLPDNTRKLLDFLLIFVFFYFIQLTIPTKKLDRYILPAFAVISLISSMFFVWLFEKIDFKKSWQKILAVFLFLIPGIYTNFLVHPDYFSYFNPMFGGLKTGVKVLEPKWLIGMEEVTDYFKKLSEEQNLVFSSGKSFEELVYKKNGRELLDIMTVGFKEKYYTQIWPFFREFGAWAVVKELAPFAERTKYFVYPIWDDTSQEESDMNLSYFDTIKLRGVPLYVVYKNEKDGVHVK